MRILFALLLIGGSWPDSSLKPWFNSLKSAKGLCCSYADGRTVIADDWGIAEVSGHNQYWVVIDGNRLTVPDDALVTVPNIFGQAIVWPHEEKGKLAIRCFIPGAET